MGSVDSSVTVILKMGFEVVTFVEFGCEFSVN